MSGIILLGAIAVSLILGLGAGYMIGRAGGEPEEKSQESPASSAYPSDALHIWRDPQRKQLVIQIGGRVFRSPDDLSMRERKVMVGLLTYLRKWLGLPDQSASAPSPAAPPQPSQPPPATQAPHPSPASQAAPPPRPHSPPAPQDEPSPAASTPKSIVAQIDDILQKKLAVSALKHRGIRLMESPNGGMTIWVGLESYTAIDDVPDAEVVAMIRAAVQEWERR